MTADLGSESGASCGRAARPELAVRVSVRRGAGGLTIGGYARPPPSCRYQPHGLATHPVGGFAAGSLAIRWPELWLGGGSVGGMAGGPRQARTLSVATTPLFGRDAELVLLRRRVDWLGRPADHAHRTTRGRSEAPGLCGRGGGAAFPGGVVFVDLTTVRVRNSLCRRSQRALGLGDAGGRPLADRVAAARWRADTCCWSWTTSNT